jgi:hypothetical protein
MEHEFLRAEEVDGARSSLAADRQDGRLDRLARAGGGCGDRLDQIADFANRHRERREIGRVACLDIGEHLLATLDGGGVVWGLM